MLPMFPFALAMAFLLGQIVPAQDSAPIGLRVEDTFGRPLLGRGLTLVDWEGYIANPAITFFIRPPVSAHYPARVVVRSREPRVYFDLPSRAGPYGPTKELRLAGPERMPVTISIFPDRDTADEDHVLTIEFTDADGDFRSIELPTHIVDQDRDRPGSFRITVDFSQDRTGFFNDEARRAAVVRAAEDWAYFFDGDGLDPTGAGSEATLIWNPDGFHSTRRVENQAEYTGYLLYAYGIDGPLLRSGGEPSRLGGFQSLSGEALPIRRSGGYEAEIKGNYNRKGWAVGLGDTEWWKATNLSGVGADLDSIAHHEIGHALVFNPANTRFREAKATGELRDEHARAYLGSDPTIDRSDHLTGSIDPSSLRGAYGNEYHGRMPQGRWLVTKLDLLCAQAIGYRLRETSAFLPLTLRTEVLPDGTASAPYSAVLRADGGVPSYHWEVVGGALPAGVTLDSFTGELCGTPRRPGAFEFKVRLLDSDARGVSVTRSFWLTIGDQ